MRWHGNRLFTPSHPGEGCAVSGAPWSLLISSGCHGDAAQRFHHAVARQSTVHTHFIPEKAAPSPGHPGVCSFLPGATVTSRSGFTMRWHGNRPFTLSHPGEGCAVSGAPDDQKGPHPGRQVRHPPLQRGVAVLPSAHTGNGRAAQTLSLTHLSLARKTRASPRAEREVALPMLRRTPLCARTPPGGTASTRRRSPNRLSPHG